jgi:tRNA 5-methylaminomethyl-2-thiouridine biosynthesis bifunctional protein
VTPASVLIIGAGLAGAACASACASRGCTVSVLSAQPGASSLPVGLLVPQIALQDTPLAAATRAGVAHTLALAQELLREGSDWQRVTVRQKLIERDHRPERSQKLLALPDLFPEWLERDGDDLIHLQAAWIKPSALICAWLAQPSITHISAQVAALRQVASQWQALDSTGRVIGQADHLVLAAAMQCTELLASCGLPCPSLEPVYGQVAYGAWDAQVFQSQQVVNGNGHYIPAVPLPGGSMWLSGSTFEHPPLVAPEQRLHTGLRANHERLGTLLPPSDQQLINAQFDSGQVKVWQGLRASRHDRMPLLMHPAPGLHLLTALGSRGLTFAGWYARQLADTICGKR